MILTCAGDPYDMGRIGLDCPPLPFAPDALKNVGFSHGSIQPHYEQHGVYCQNALRLVRDLSPELDDETLLSVVRWAARHRDYGGPDDLFSQAGQAWNHAFFWLSLKPRAIAVPPTRLSRMPHSEFRETALGSAAAAVGCHSFRGLQDEFIEVAKNSFGSEWAWLVLDKNELGIVLTEGAESPITSGAMPLLALDLWEHAYFHDWKFGRAKYVETAVRNALNWDRANTLLTLEFCDR